MTNKTKKVPDLVLTWNDLSTLIRNGRITKSGKAICLRDHDVQYYQLYQWLQRVR